MKFAAVFLALPLVLAASAQEPEVPVLRVETRLVNVPVNATDAMDIPIPDLKQSDFQILEEGKPQKIAIFERQATTPLSMVMAIDTSESVITQFQTERDAAKRFVKQMLRPQDEMDLISFSDTVDEVVPFTNDAGRMNAGISNLHKGDATSLYDAIYLASQRLTEAKRDATRRKILVIVTDGGNTTKGMRYQQAIEAAERAGAAIYPIIMVPIEADAGRNTGGEHALIQMAQDTGGKYFYVLDKHDLDKAFAHLSDDLRTQYLLGYYAPPRHRDDGFRTINVRLTDASRGATARLRYKSGYFADGH